MPCGSIKQGVSFNNLDFVHKEFIISSIAVELTKGALSALTVRYTNGLVVTQGKATEKSPIVLRSFTAGERVIAASIETGSGPEDGEEIRVLSLKLYTNRGRQLSGTADNSSPLGGAYNRDGTLYKNVKTTYFDTPFQNGSLRGFWGRSEEKTVSGGAIWRLGLAWGDVGSVSLCKDTSRSILTTALVRINWSFSGRRDTCRGRLHLRSVWPD